MPSLVSPEEGLSGERLKQWIVQKDENNTSSTRVECAGVVTAVRRLLVNLRFLEALAAWGMIGHQSAEEIGGG